MKSEKVLQAEALFELARGGDTGLLLAMGPGFSIEQLLVCWPD